MEDQGKRLLVAIALCMGILLVWQWLSPKPPPKPPAPPAAETPAGGEPASGQLPPSGDSTAAAPTAPPSKPRGPEQKVTLTTGDYVLTLSSYGGALSSLTLSGTQYRSKGGGTEQPLDLVRTGENPSWYPLAIAMPESTFGVDPAGEWTLEKRSETEAVATWRSAELEVVKRIQVVPDSYGLDVDVSMTNRSAREAEQRLAVSLFGLQDPNASTGGVFSYAPPTWVSVCYLGGERREDTVKALKAGPKTRTGDVRWAGLYHRYFLFAVAPRPAPGEQYTCNARLVAGRSDVFESALVFPAAKLKPGESVTRKMTLFAGPKILDQLEAVSARVQGPTALEEAVDWGPPPPSWFTFIARPLLSLLRVFHRWVGNWGIAIILLTIVVKLLTLYWTHKSMKSMKALGKLKPKMDEIRAKWPDDRQRQNLEMMNLYKTHSINPLGGCLPMLLQMPIWMALYSALSAAAELHQAPFFGWIRDLTAPDPYYILPIVLTALMFLQARLAPATVDSTQQKMMMYMMPIMFGAFSLVFPSGLTVYILTNTVLGMVHQIYLNKTDEPGPMAPAPVVAETPPPAPSGGRPGPGKGKGRSAKKPAKA